MTQSKLFYKLIHTIEDFYTEDPLTIEAQLERKLAKYLREKGFAVTSQVTKKRDRYDLICKFGNETVCLELKINAEVKDLKQFDRYLPKFRDGLIVVCWIASFTVRTLFDQVEQQSPIPVKLIEISKRYNLA